MNKGVVAVDLFCGAGGLTRGLLDAGIKVKKGYDLDKKSAETYEKNNNIPFYERNVSDINGKELKSDLDIKNNYFLLAGCAPCQPFSLINKREIDGDDRRILLLQFGRLIKEAKPDFIFMENVPGLMKGKGKDIFKAFIKILDEEKYKYDFNVLDARDYGVPQKRKRLVLLASKHGEIKIPVPEFGPRSRNKIPYITVRGAIEKYDKIMVGKDSPIQNHEARRLSETNQIRLKFIKKNGGSRSDLPENLVLECHKDYKGHGDVYGRMKWEEPAPTLTCKCTSISNGRFAHPSQDRGISVREAAAIQTFDDDYVFYGPIGQTTKMVGNAVPVRFAKELGSVFLKNG